MDRLTISFDPEKGKLRITDGGNTTMWAPIDQRRELVARFNKWREAFGRPPLLDPDLPRKEPEPEIQFKSFNIDPLTGRPLVSLKRPKSSNRQRRKAPVADPPRSAPHSASPADQTKASKTVVVHVRKTKAPFVYIGRSFAEFGDSIWRNPFEIEIGCGRKCVLEKYEAYVKARPELMARLHTLKGKTLGCWCNPKACHGDVLVKLIKETCGDE